MGEKRRPTKSERKASQMIPWVDEVVRVGEELSAHEIIGRISDANAPNRRASFEPSTGTYRNLKHLPNAAGLSYILKVSDKYEKVLTSKVAIWRRVK